MSVNLLEIQKLVTEYLETLDNQVQFELFMTEAEFAEEILEEFQQWLMKEKKE